MVNVKVKDIRGGFLVSCEKSSEFPLGKRLMNVCAKFMTS
jgi:hypothetical protein